jgi:hypothetical protein
MGRGKENHRVFFKNFITTISLLIPIFYIFSGSTINSLGVIVTENQAESEFLYNNYISISDSFLFSSLLLVSVRRDLFSLLIHLLNTLLLILIGSRTPALIGIIAFLIFLFIIISYYYTGFKLGLKNSKKGKLSLPLVTSIFLIFPAMILFLTYFHEQIFNILNLDNLFSSRVYISLFDKSLDAFERSSGRNYIFQCFLDNHLSSFDKVMLGGPPDMGCNNVSYLHSTLSIFVDAGIIGFLIYFYLIFMLIKPLFVKAEKTISSNFELRVELKFYLVTAVSFLLLGLSSRNDISLWLPALAFCYSSAKIAKLEDKSLSPNP